MEDFLIGTPIKKERVKENKIVNGAKRWIGYISVVAISIAYMTYGLFSVEKSGKTVWSILVSGFVALIVGTFIYQGWGSQGLLSGSADPAYIATKEKHSQKVTEATPYFKHSHAWEKQENLLAVTSARTTLLSEAGLDYFDFFNEKGKFVGKYFKETTDMTKQELLDVKVKNVAIAKAKTHKITPVNTTRLTMGVSTNKNVLDPNKLALTEREFMKKSFFSSTVIRVVMSIVFGYFVLTPTQGVNWAGIAWTTMQVLIFQMSGAMNYYSKYSFKTETEVSGMLQKINLLNRLIQFGKAQEVKDYGDFNEITTTISV